MWQVWNSTPFAADWCGFRDTDGAELWTVAIKATFTLARDGGLQLAQEQLPLARAARFAGDPASSDLLAEADFAATRQATDVLVLGTAHAPKGRPAKEFSVGLSIVRDDESPLLEKRLRVTGPRTWQKTASGDIALAPPEPIAELPLSYASAFGGVAADGTWWATNPLGQGFASRPEDLIDQPAPSLEDAGSPMVTWTDRPASVGLGPIPRHWQPRLGYAGTYDEAWEQQRRPLVPRDFDARFWQAAPADQQVPGFLQGGERVRLENLTPGGSPLTFRVPRLRFALTTRFRGLPDEPGTPALEVMTIEPDDARVVLTWQSRLPCHHTVQRLLGTEVRLVESSIEIPEPVGIGAQA